MSGYYIHQLTEEEIAKLPFPETARAIGGVPMQAPTKLSDEDTAKIEAFIKAHTKNNGDKIEIKID